MSAFNLSLPTRGIRDLNQFFYDFGKNSGKQFNDCTVKVMSRYLSYTVNAAITNNTTHVIFNNSNNYSQIPSNVFYYGNFFLRSQLLTYVSGTCQKEMAIVLWDDVASAPNLVQIPPMVKTGLTAAELRSDTGCFYYLQDVFLLDLSAWFYSTTGASTCSFDFYFTGFQIVYS